MNSNLFSKHIKLEESQVVARAFEDLFNIIRTLRAPDGCPWDLEQTPSTLQTDLLEEVYELIEAIGDNDSQHTMEELGDVLLSVLLISYIEEQNSHFSVHDVIVHLTEKLIRRHPHVFGDRQVKDSTEVSTLWEEIKTHVEKRKPKANIPRHLPPLLQAEAVQKIAAKKGFDWKNYEGAIEKIHEEINEIEDIVDRNESDLEMEIGDLFFSVVNLSRKLKVSPITAIDKSTQKFMRRFTYIEERMNWLKLEMNEANIEKMEDLWQQSKTDPP